ncbi:MAG TPA: hypothetical protein VHL51_02920 [Gaiellales bacterium]|jgi:hypothetical protein|nr:hypothetical protein [Gaiellales bacterium]
MTPSEMTALLARLNDRIRSAVTGASSLAVLAVVSIIAGYGVHRVAPELAKTVAFFAILGGLGMIVAYRFYTWQREEVYDDIVLQGFRHVHPAAVARRAAALVSRTRRTQLADTLDRYVSAAQENHPTPVPVHRSAILAVRPQVRQLSLILRTEEVELEPAGMVLLTRLITDGATSPLYRLSADERELRRELDRIRAALAADDDTRLAA